MTSKRLLPKREHECKFCKKAFSSDRTLSKHMCVKKRRWNDRNTTGASLGFRVFQRFYQLTTSGKKVKTQEEFINSRYYNDFVTFGRYLVDRDPINAEKFIEHVIMNVEGGIKKWKLESTYKKYLINQIQNENVDVALTRSINNVSAWADNNGVTFNTFFSDVGVNEACTLITEGKISPWFMYSTVKLNDLLERLNEEHAKEIEKVVNQDFWAKKLLASREDREFASMIMAQAGF